MHQPIFCLLFSSLPRASRLFSTLLCFLSLASTRSSLRVRKFHRVEGTTPLSAAREAPQSTRLPRDMLALATKLEQGVANGTFTRQDELAIFAVVLATAALAGGIVVAACCWCETGIGERKYGGRARSGARARRGCGCDMLMWDNRPDVRSLSLFLRVMIILVICEISQRVYECTYGRRALSVNARWS